MNEFVGLAAAIVAVGLVGGCAHRRHTVDPDAPIHIHEGGLGYTYWQAGTKLSSGGLFHVLQANGADVRAELEGHGAATALTTVVSGIGGGLIGWPLGTLGSGDASQVFLIPIGASMVTVAFPIALKLDRKVHRAVLLHNAYRGVGDFSSIPPLSAPRTTWLVRSVFSGGYSAVDETIHAAGQAGALSTTGPTGSYDWTLGYFLMPGVAVSGNLLGLVQVSDEVHSGGGLKPVGRTSRLYYTGALANVTYYFKPNLGLYAVGGVGYGAEFGETSSLAVQPGASGLAWTGGVGWDFTVADAGALGVFARGIYSALRGSFDEELGDSSLRQTNFSDRWSGVTMGFSVTYY